MSIKSITSSIITTLGNQSSMVPLDIKDVVNSMGLTYYAGKSGKKVEAQDKFIDEFGTDNLNMFHEIYDLYKQSKTYKPLKNEHPLNKLRAVRNAIRKDKRFISEGENILIVDDFLAEGNAALGLIDIAKQGKANVIGMSAAIEKFFQGGHEKIEALGVPVYCPASIKGFKDNKLVF